MSDNEFLIQQIEELKDERYQEDELKKETESLTEKTTKQLLFLFFVLQLRPKIPEKEPTFKKRVNILENEDNKKILDGIKKKDISERQKLYDELKDKKLDFINIDGRNYNLKRYLRNQLELITVEELHNQIEKNGEELLILNTVFNCSNLCEPFQGRIFASDKNNNDYPYFRIALFSEGGGVGHLGCRHFFTSYYPELDGLNYNFSRSVNLENRNKYKRYLREKEDTEIYLKAAKDLDLKEEEIKLKNKIKRINENIKKYEENRDFYEIDF